MTAKEREKGTKSSQPLAEFGELVLFRQLRERESGRTEKFAVKDVRFMIGPRRASKR